jgi:hypothetical protein
MSKSKNSSTIALPEVTPETRITPELVSAAAKIMQYGQQQLSGPRVGAARGGRPPRIVPCPCCGREDKLTSIRAHIPTCRKNKGDNEVTVSMWLEQLYGPYQRKKQSKGANHNNAKSTARGQQQPQALG